MDLKLQAIQVKIMFMMYRIPKQIFSKGLDKISNSWC